MKRGVLIVLVAALALPAAANAQGTVTEIATGDDFFNPENVSAEVGSGSFHWQWGPLATRNQHNVVEQNKLFNSGPPALSGDFTTTPSAGTFLYVCEIHGSISSSGQPIGMAGEIAVKPTATPKGKKALITWATETTDTGTQYDIQQKVGSKDPKIVEKKTSDLSGAFKLKPGTKYQFQVRSRQGSATSDFSPKLKLKG
jgi:plastocyanin